MSYRSGVGRTSLAYGLYQWLVNQDMPVQIAGIDITKPDLLDASFDFKLDGEDIFALQPAISNDRCNFCGNCAKHCSHNALQFDRYKPEIRHYDSNCYVCLECVKACSREGISTVKRKIGVIYQGRNGAHAALIGRLNEDSDLQIPMLSVLNAHFDKDADIICDFQPGDGPGVEMPLMAMDFLLIILQNEDAGKPYLDQMIELVKRSKKSAGVLIADNNDSSEISEEVVQLCQQNSFSLLGNLPFDHHRNHFDVNDSEHAEFYEKLYANILADS